VFSAIDLEKEQHRRRQWPNLHFHVGFVHQEMQHLPHNQYGKEEFLQLPPTQLKGGVHLQFDTTRPTKSFRVPRVLETIAEMLYISDLRRLQDDPTMLAAPCRRGLPSQIVSMPYLLSSSCSVCAFCFLRLRLCELFFIRIELNDFSRF